VFKSVFSRFSDVYIIARIQTLRRGENLQITAYNYTGCRENYENYQQKILKFREKVMN
jgi:hypothetical protein